jgi:putative endonuclease
MAKSWHWFVYIIECTDGLYYTGLTWNLENRLEQHRLGKGSNFTQKHGFKCLKYFEEYQDLNEARNREVQIKNYSRSKKEALWRSKE